MHDKHNTQEALSTSSACLCYAPNYTFDLRRSLCLLSVTPGLTHVFWKGQIVSVCFVGHTEPAGSVHLGRFTVKAAREGTRGSLRVPAAETLIVDADTERHSICTS